MNNPAIVVVAYNRPASLQRLLTSIANGQYPNQQLTLHISIDNSDVPAVAEIADAFEWKFGPKIISLADQSLGLKKHILQCGDLTEKYESIIVLEDDLVLAPHFYAYASDALRFYANENQVAGISLYKYQIAESCGLPFHPIDDGSDVCFMQIASSWGQAWNRQQWSTFKTWLLETEDKKYHLLPEYVQKWGPHSWKKYFINYLIDTDRYFVFPQKSFSTNFEDPGTNAITNDLYQVPLERSNRKLVLSTIQESKSMYDAYFELTSDAFNRQSTVLKEFDFEIDLYGTKPVSGKAKTYLLTTRKGRDPKLSFAAKMQPLIHNVFFSIEGNEIGLYNRETIDAESAHSRHFFSDALLQKINQERRGVVAVSVVIPVVTLHEDAILKTLRSLVWEEAFHQCIIACPKELCAQIQLLLSNEGISVEIVSSVFQDENELLLEGLNRATKELHTWCRPGSTFSQDAFIQLPKIFNGFSQVNWIRGIETACAPDSYANFNTAPYRWNLYMIAKYKTPYFPKDTELMFWRKSVYNREKTNASFELNTMVSCFMEHQPLHVVAYQLGKRVNKESSEIKSNDQKHTLSLGRRALSALGYRFFIKDRSPLRILFVETQELPFVLRYDFNGKGFYVSKY